MKDIFVADAKSNIHTALCTEVCGHTNTVTNPHLTAKTGLGSQEAEVVVSKCTK